MLSAPNAAKRAKTVVIMIATAMVNLTAAGTAIATAIWTEIGIATAMADWTAALTAMMMNALTVAMTGTAMAGWTGHRMDAGPSIGAMTTAITGAAIVNKTEIITVPGAISHRTVAAIIAAFPSAFR